MLRYDAEATYSGKYPIARHLNKKPNEPLDPLRVEFIKYILSKDGQTQTENGGYFPISNERPRCVENFDPRELSAIQGLFTDVCSIGAEKNASRIRQPAVH